ncbi:MAG: OsmC family peroxiredoxin [Bacteroidia bacterium]|nr:OsmC family peroxiredoxin [Bacteroidia bacterium]
MPNAKFKVEARSDSNARVLVKARNFDLIIDEPENLGGDDRGANPVEFVLAALAGCLNVVGNLIAKEMDFKISNLKFEIEGELNPMKFLGKSSAERAGYQNITAVVSGDTDADEKTIEEWLSRVEERCPVSDNLQNPTPVNIELKK